MLELSKKSDFPGQLPTTLFRGGDLRRKSGKPFALSLLTTLLRFLELELTLGDFLLSIEYLPISTFGLVVHPFSQPLNIIFSPTKLLL
jgi:hypothetical protein